MPTEIPSIIFENACRRIFDGDLYRTADWCMSPCKELDNKTPLEVCEESDIGEQQVLDLINSLEHHDT